MRPAQGVRNISPIILVLSFLYEHFVVMLISPVFRHFLP